MGYKDYLLSRGYAVIGTSLNVFGTSCADLISAESVMMLKEYFIKHFGAPRYTIGAGGSGGSMQQSMIASNYPGLLDGIIPGRVYPDIMEFFLPLSDCELLMHAFDTSSLAWTDAQKAAVSGYKNFNYCVNNGTRYPNLRANNCARSAGRTAFARVRSGDQPARRALHVPGQHGQRVRHRFRDRLRAAPFR